VHPVPQLIPRSLAILETGVVPWRASSTARCRNSGGCGGSIRTSFLVTEGHLRSGVRATREARGP
jgi:hypothetical protein